MQEVQSKGGNSSTFSECQVSLLQLALNRTEALTQPVRVKRSAPRQMADAAPPRSSQPAPRPGCAEPCLASARPRSNAGFAREMLCDLVAEAAEVAIESYRKRTAFFSLI